MQSYPAIIQFSQGLTQKNSLPTRKLSSLWKTMPLMFMAEVINGLSCHYSCRITRAGGQKGLMYLKWHIKRINSSFICKVHWLSSKCSEIPLMKQLAKWLHISASHGAEPPCWRGKQVIIIHTLRFLIQCAGMGNWLRADLFSSPYTYRPVGCLLQLLTRDWEGLHLICNVQHCSSVLNRQLLIRSGLQDTYYRFSPCSPILWPTFLTMLCLRYTSFTLKFTFEYLISFVICNVGNVTLNELHHYKSN